MKTVWKKWRKIRRNAQLEQRNLHEITDLHVVSNWIFMTAFFNFAHNLFIVQEITTSLR